MEGIMTILTDKQETFLRSILLTGMTTHGASLRGVVGIHLDRHTSSSQSFVGNHAVQLCERPFGLSCIGFALRACNFLAPTSFCSVSDVSQVLKSDHRLGVVFNYPLGDHMIRVLLQPSLSSANLHQTARCRTSAFLLKTLSKSRIMIGFGNSLLSRMEGAISFRVSGYRQVTHTDINPNQRTTRPSSVKMLTCCSFLKEESLPY